jgi:hypothetical protein
MATIVNEIDKALQATFPRYTTVDGVANFTWVKYADDASGTNMSDSPTGKAYIGFAFNKTTATESTTPSDYTWSLVRGSDGTSTFAATVYLQQSTQPSAPTGGSYNFSNSTLTAPSGWSTSQPTTATTPTWAARFTFTTTTAGATVTGGTWSTPVSVAQSGGAGSGTPGSQTAIAYLYQWGSATPSAPTGTSTLTWATAANSAYTGSDGWAIAAPTNPGFPGWRLYVATVSVTASGGTASSTVSYSGAAISAWSQNGQNGAPGVKSAAVTAYQWALSAPTASGTATYTWATGKYDNVPSTGWTATKGSAPGNGYTLYEASVRLVDSSGATTSNIDWTTASIAGIAFVSSGGGKGDQGASAKRAYVLVSGATLSVTPTTSTVTGNAFPATGTWGETNAWQATPPNPSAGQSVFQADGIFDPVANQTVWNVPYLSALKVGSLSAISANFGAMTAGSIDLGTGTASWHVDPTGNQWAGASSYAAAPFRVSNAGFMWAQGATLKSVTILADDGSTLFKTSQSLAQQVASNPNLCPTPIGMQVYNGATGNRNGDVRFGDGQYIWMPPTSDNSFTGALSGALRIPANAKYTVSFDAYCTDNSGRQLIVDVQGTGVDSTGITIAPPSTGPTRYSFTETMPSGTNGDASLRMFTVQAGGGTFVISSIKVELGNTVTPWCDSIITKANASTYIQYAAIDIAYINKASITDLSALNAYTGTLHVGGGGICVGDYTGYSWVPAGQSGAYFGAGGILLGSANNGKYFQVTTDGNMYAPGFKLENAQLTLTNPVIVNPQVQSGFSASIASTSNNYYWTVSHQNKSAYGGSYNAVPANGSGNYSYNWSVSTNSICVASLGAAPTGQQNSLYANSQGGTGEFDFYLTCIVTDLNTNISKTTGTLVTMNFT